MEHSTDFANMIQFAENGLKGNWDGWSKWQELKIAYSEETIGSWNELILNEEYSEYRERILAELPEYNADGTSHGPNHFIIQCLRIPYINELSVRRLMQIAYCIGQFQAVIHTYDQNYVDEFYRMRLNKIETYV